MEQRSTKVLSNMIWRFLERCGAQGVSFVVSIVLARILMPEDYGTIALVTVFTKIMEVFVNSGLGTSLIQKKDADDLDFSSVFFYNMLMCCCLYVGMFLAAPFISSFYNRPDLVPVIRVLSLTLIISGLKNVQHAYVARNLMFKRFFYATLGGTIGAAVIGIYLAYKGAGVWALVAQYLFNNLVDTIILWFTVEWHPKMKFSFKRLKDLLAFGWKLLASSLLETIYNDIRQLIIGKMYSSEDLAYYNRGSQIPALAVTNVSAAIDSVLLPVLSAVQDDKAHVRNMIRKSITTSFYVVAPVMMGIAAIADPLVRVLLTDKWSASIPFLRVFCFVYMLYPIHYTNLNAIKAMGRSDIYLRIEVIKKVVGITALLISMQFGTYAMACSLLVTGIISMLINCRPNGKLLNYGYISQLKDLLPAFSSSVCMFLVVYAMNYLHMHNLPKLCLQVVVGIVAYVFLSIIFKSSELQFILAMIRRTIDK